MSFWLQLGVSGFRIDAAAHLIDMSGIQVEHADDPHEYLVDLRRFIGRRAGNVVLLGEADVPLHDRTAFFGTEGREELDMLFNFRQAESVFLALAQRSADPLRHLDVLPPTPGSGQWADSRAITTSSTSSTCRSTSGKRSMRFGQGEDRRRSDVK